MTGERSDLMSWVAGHRLVRGSSAAAIVLVEDAAHLDPLRRSGVVGPGTRIYAPIGASDAGRAVVTYEGSIRQGGDELFLGDDFAIQVQGYAVSQFLSVLGPTVVRVDDDDDLAAFLLDADTARQDGAFPDFATNQAVLLADLPAFGLGSGLDGPAARLFVGADGQMSTSAAGLRLGSVGDDLATLSTAWERRNAAAAHPCAVCLGTRVTESERVSGLVDRPWLARYLVALSVLRRLRGEGVTDASISGFGARLHPDAVQITEPFDTADSTVLVAWTQDTGYLVDPATGRLFAVPHRIAGLVELVAAAGSVEAATACARDESVGSIIDLVRAAGFAVPATDAAVVR